MKEIEAKLNEQDLDFIDSWVATQWDVDRSGNDSYYPQCEIGDLLVSICGRDLGSISYVRNYGKPKRKKNDNR